VLNAVVQFDPITDANSSTFTKTTGDALPNNTGYVPALSATTDATGKAVFTGNTLVLGGAYTANVLQLAFKLPSGATVQLARFVGPTLLVGLDNVFQIINMADLTVSTNVVFATSASNQLPTGVLSSQVTPSGQLVINFSGPVTISAGANGFNAAVNPGTANAGGAGAALPLAPTVTATPSNGGATLTLTPTFNTLPAATDHGATITYGNGTALIVPVDFPAQGFTLFGGARPMKLACSPAGAGVCAGDGTTNLNGIVDLTGP
jgi:hypothetical protein